MAKFAPLGVTNLDSLVHVRLTSDEKARLQEDADIAEMSMSALVRSRYFGRKVSANVDRETLRELRRIGGLLKHVHVESGGAYSKQTGGALDNVRDLILLISSKIKE